MPKQIRSSRKVSDADIIRMNSVGLSLSTIAKALGVHPSTITLRLKSLGIEASDTRRTFMEDLFLTLSTDQQEWLADQLGPHINIRDYMRGLIINEYLNKTGSKNVNKP